MKKENLNRYILNGVICTITGSVIFWLTYPLGPFYSTITTDVLVHSLRYKIIKNFVFTSRKGYKVKPLSYIITQIPAIAVKLLIINFLYKYLNREILTITMTGITVIISYILSEIIFSNNEKNDFD